MKNGTVYFIIALFLLISTFSFAQENNIKSKIKEIQGKVKSIVITTDKGETVFEGKEAEELLDRMKNRNISVKVVNDEDIDFGKGFVFLDDDNLHLSEGGVYEFKFEKADSDGVRKDIEVTIDKDGKKVSITNTAENGEKSVEVLEGEEAEKWLEEHKSENDDDFYVWTDKDDDSGDFENIEKNIKVEIDNGEKVVTIKTTKDGKESEEILKGEDAEKWLEEHKADEKHNLIFIGGGDADTYIVKLDNDEDIDRRTEDGKTIKIDLDDENGEMKITVTAADKNGGKNIETYEGEEAEKFLEEHEREDSDNCKKVKIIKIKKVKKDSDDD